MTKPQNIFFDKTQISSHIFDFAAHVHFVQLFVLPPLQTILKLNIIQDVYSAAHARTRSQGILLLVE